ncbi:MAG: phosphate/phosphite/phosphonate ABC transporter substrate-binding protein [Gammaproteobacteria bacterium]|nr:phosphate/phosphite/phosphonate ABC transporter substrate-binding protein [Gammaproteobacteria bacterium]MCW8909935.1 phosphate/phosphite/phosphonate ABC transporter substrate-binding protein [Gammaproteobacteria bacterium]MCW9003698.1 phosphate/phosphite/phosphonate ABC transporter substrate-binding protein [Gammaproteobacteria bacterium]MCW9057181.1 phosphate/phosphite/phosphonate ABC transporter substrate-binding protein [Gammaproteobacteria bacterium]
MVKILSGKKVTNLIPSLLIITLLLIPSLHKHANADNNLILAVHPYLPAEELKKKFTPLANYLSNQTGMKIIVKIGSSYDEHIQYIGQDKVDIAYMGPASYVTMTNQFGSKPLLARLEINSNPWFQGNIITRNDSDINTLEDLKGKHIAFGDPNSTMSYIIPHYMLTKAGVFTDPLTKHQFLYSHNNVALGVLSGDFDAGAVKPEVFRKFEAKGLHTVALTPKISEHLFITRSNLPVKNIEKLRHAMLNIKYSDEGMIALTTIKKSITGLVKTSDNDYENLRKIIIESQQSK